jgi:hypothetical protein
MINAKRTKTADDLGKKVCKALGLDTGSIQGITIILEAGRPIELEIRAHDCDGELENVDWSEMWQGAEITINIIKFEKDQ